MEENVKAYIQTIQELALELAQEKVKVNTLLLQVQQLKELESKNREDKK